MRKLELNNYFNINNDSIEERMPLIDTPSVILYELEKTVLPKEIVFHIFSFASAETLIHKASLTCKNWKLLASEHFEIWRSFLPKGFVARQEGRDYRKVYLDWLSLGNQLEKKDYTSQRIVCPFGGFYTCMVTNKDRLFLGSNKGFLSIIDTQRMELLSSIRIEKDRAIQAIDNSGDMLVVATIGQERLAEEEQLYTLEFENQPVDGALYFYDSNEIDEPPHIVPFAHAVKSIKIHYYTATTAIVAVHAKAELFLFDENGHSLFSSSSIPDASVPDMNQTLCFYFYGSFLFCIKANAGKNTLVCYEMKNTDHCLQLEEIASKEVPGTISIEPLLEINSLDEIIVSNKDALNIYKISIENLFKEEGVFSDRELQSLCTVQKIIYYSKHQEILLIQKKNERRLRTAKYEHHLIFLKNEKIQATWEFASYHFSSLKQPKICLADSKVFILASRQPTQHLDENLVLDCYDFKDSAHLDRLTSQISWVTGRMPFSSYLLRERKWTILGPLAIAGVFYPSTIKLISFLTRHYELSDYAYVGMITVQSIIVLLLSAAHAASTSLFYRKKFPATLTLLGSIYNAPLALVRPRPKLIERDCFVETLNGYLLWKVERIREESVGEKIHAEELLSNAKEFEDHICPISRAPIRHPVEFNGVLFEKSWLLEFLEYSLMISGERPTKAVVKPDHKLQQEIERRWTLINEMKIEEELV